MRNGLFRNFVNRNRFCKLSSGRAGICVALRMRWLSRKLVPRGIRWNAVNCGKTAVFQNGYSAEPLHMTEAPALSCKMRSSIQNAPALVVILRFALTWGLDHCALLAPSLSVGTAWEKSLAPPSNDSGRQETPVDATPPDATRDIPENRLCCASL